MNIMQKRTDTNLERMEAKTEAKIKTIQIKMDSIQEKVEAC
jgi:hypothetical protein